MKSTIGLALGSGAARGLSHFGVFKALQKYQVKPDIICGTSMGALVGAAYVTGHLDELEDWFRAQTTRRLLRHLDINLFASGGIADGELFIKFLKTKFGDYQIEALDIPYAAVACDMRTGKEIWLTTGSIWDAVRASGAYPGLLTPAKRDNQWLVDGGIVNPVPVSVCRALGANTVMGVNLNSDLVSYRPPKKRDSNTKRKMSLDNTVLSKIGNRVKQAINEKTPFTLGSKEPSPGIIDVINCTVNVMQDRITRSRLAGDPADILFTPRLDQVGFFDTENAEDIIMAGEQSVLQHHRQLDYLLE